MTISQGRHRLEFEVDSDLKLFGRESEVQSIFSNLIANAVQYTPPGGIVKVRWWGNETGAHLSVADSGIGIAVKDLERVTERFYRGGRRTLQGQWQPADWACRSPSTRWSTTRGVSTLRASSGWVAPLPGISRRIACTAKPEAARRGSTSFNCHCSVIKLSHIQVIFARHYRAVRAADNQTKNTRGACSGRSFAPSRGRKPVRVCVFSIDGRVFL